MGAFFTNLQVAVGPDALDVVRSVLDADAGRDGMVAVTDGEKADRSVIVAPGKRWMSVYDEASESQDHAVLDRIGKALSKATGAAAFSVLIHDSDVLRLALYESGRRIDAYDSNPGYFGGSSKGARPEKHLAAWRHLGPEEALRAVFGGGELFAEAALPALADALGVGPDRLDRGQKYLADGSFELPEGAVVWGWRAKERPEWDKPAEGPPRLETTWEQAERVWGHKRPPQAGIGQEAAVGGRVHLGVTTMNAGGAGTGLEVEVVSGDVVTWLTAQAVLGNPKQAKWIERPLERDGDRWVARFPEAALPPGQASAAVPDSPAAMMRAMEARFATQVHVNVIGQGERVGRADVIVRLTPGAGTGTSERGVVVVKGTEGRPLRARSDLHPTMLAPLLDRSHLVALVALERSALPRAGEIVAAIAPALPTEGKVRATKFGRPGQAPKLSTGKAQGFVGGKRWAELLAAAVEEGVQIDITWVPTAEAREGAADVHVGAGILPPPDEAPVITLGIAGGEGAEAPLVAAIDRLARDGVLLQAFVTRWAHAPGPDSTPYELASGVHGQITTQRAWATRWLRGVGPGWVWLGRELAARVSITGEAVGEAVRIEVREVAATEKALADVLPSTDDWRSAVARRWGQ